MSFFLYSHGSHIRISHIVKLISCSQEASRASFAVMFLLAACCSARKLLPLRSVSHDHAFEKFLSAAAWGLAALLFDMVRRGLQTPKDLENPRSRI